MTKIYRLCSRNAFETRAQNVGSFSAFAFPTPQLDKFILPSTSLPPWNCSLPPGTGMFLHVLIGWLLTLSTVRGRETTLYSHAQPPISPFIIAKSCSRSLQPSPRSLNENNENFRLSNRISLASQSSHTLWLTTFLAVKGSFGLPGK